MAKRCVIPDCFLEGDYSQLFHFPNDRELLNRWIIKIPAINLTDLNHRKSAICEHHFRPGDLIDGPGFSKELANGAVPENFPNNNDEIDFTCCRFCLRKLKDQKNRVDDLITFHYKNFIQEEFCTDSPQLSFCEHCYNVIINCSLIKMKIQENQKRLADLQPLTEFLDMKMEHDCSNEELESKNVSEMTLNSRKPKRKNKKIEEIFDIPRKLPKATEVVR
jgi:hypothetical protein